MARINLNDKKHIAIDLGTSNTRIFIEGPGLVFNEPTLLAVDFKTRKVIAIGTEAKKYVGKLSGQMDILKPMKNGIISDIKMLALFISKVLEKHKDILKDSFVTLACPISVTEVERKALIRTVENLGAIFVNTEDDIKLALLGAGVDIDKPQGFLGLDMGAGKAACGIVTSGGLVASRWSKAAGNAIDAEIVKALKTKNNILIGDVTAENIKNEVGTVVRTKNPLKIKAYGYDLLSGMPTETIITDQEINKIIQSTFGNLTILITGVLEETPSELAGDVIRNGIYITGGLTGIVGTKFYFEDFFEIPVHIPKNASTAVIDGAIAHKDLTIEAYIESTSKATKADF